MMSGYLRFNSTGVPAVDAILQAIENAGDYYHHTSQWQDSDDGEKSQIELIDEKIDEARVILNGLINNQYTL